MSKNAIICGIEHALGNDGCNEVSVRELHARVKATRGNFALNLEDLMTVLRELVSDGLFETFGEKSDLTEDSLVARSQTHPSVPSGTAIQL